MWSGRSIRYILPTWIEMYTLYGKIANLKRYVLIIITFDIIIGVSVV